MQTLLQITSIGAGMVAITLAPLVMMALAVRLTAPAASNNDEE